MLRVRLRVNFGLTLANWHVCFKNGTGRAKALKAWAKHVHLGIILG